MFNPVSYVKQNPVVGGLGIFVIGLAILYFLGFFKSSGGDNGASAYYAAQVADAQSGNALQAAYVNAAATTAQTQIAADAYTHVQDTWAGTQLGITQNNNATNLSLANTNNATAVTLGGYQLQQTYIDTLGKVASAAPIATTKSSNGFFGIGGGSSTSYAPSPLATSAADALSHLELYTVH